MRLFALSLSNGHRSRANGPPPTTRPNQTNSPLHHTPYTPQTLDQIVLNLGLGFHAPDLEVVVAAKTPVASIPLAIKNIWFEVGAVHGYNV